MHACMHMARAILDSGGAALRRTAQRSAAQRGTAVVGGTKRTVCRFKCIAIWARVGAAGRPTVRSLAPCCSTRTPRAVVVHVCWVRRHSHGVGGIAAVSRWDWQRHPSPARAHEPAMHRRYADLTKSATASAISRCDFSRLDQYLPKRLRCAACQILNCLPPFTAYTVT